ncbi:MAG: polysaccharide biosynthesis tyrosine autokinase [Gemmatimonadetes bacterium]|nr:polysaccharide biosynthesis tyrosine autokinase [Gemmatimonadota bacterium]
MRDRREAGEELEESFSASAVERTNLVDLSYRDHDPVLAARILNTIIALGRYHSVERLRERASARRQFIERQLADFELQLRQAQAEVQEYQEEIGAVSVETEQAGQIENILGFERQVEELRLERQLYRPILEGMEAGAGGDVSRFEGLSATPALVKNPAIADLYRRLVNLQVKRDSLISGPVGAGQENPAVQAVDDQIVTASGKLVEALREYIDGIDRQISELRRTVRRLQEQSEGLLPHAAELARRQQRVESIRKVYEALQTQLEQTRIEEASESGKLAIIDPAVVPREPVNATGLSDVMLALVLAGMLAFGSALVVDYFDDRVRSPREVRHNLGFTVLGVVPRFDPLNGGDMSEEQARVHLEKLSSPAEAYRMIRTNLSFSHAVKPRRTLVVTSPGPAEGKTTTAINLAAVLSQQGERTLLIDADLRKSSVHRLLGADGKVGLTTVLAGQGRVEDAIVPAGIDGLDALPAGPHPPNPAELLGAKQMEDLLARLVERYDRIVVDSPPVLAVADPATLARRLDGVVMVVRAGKTNRQALVEAMELLGDVGADVVGVVVNAHKPELGSYGRYRYYRDGYYATSADAGIRNRLRRLVKPGRS